MKTLIKQSISFEKKTNHLWGSSIPPHTLFIAFFGVISPNDEPVVVVASVGADLYLWSSHCACQMELMVAVSLPEHIKVGTSAFSEGLNSSKLFTLILHHLHGLLEMYATCADL